MPRSETSIETGHEAFDRLVPLVRSFLEKDTLELNMDGKRVRGYRSPDARSVWIRDLSDMMRGFRHFEPDMTSAVEHFAETQAASGRIFDYFTTYPEKLPSERENWTKYVRVPVEADVEYRFVKGAWLAWQATGDDDWIQRMLPVMDRALRYIQSHPWYWDERHGLVKRPYTIDTWDFAYTAGAHEWLQFQVDDNTFWGLMHGDNSGTYEAFSILSALHERFGQREPAAWWRQQAAGLKDRLNRVAWNGRFYTHFVKLTDVTIPGVDESIQLSLSNPMAINRGVTDHVQAVAILREYQRRRSASSAFAEWFSIDPPFPDGVFGDDKLVGGAYVNGGIMPLVGGELARAAFEHGFEEYGVDILRRYYELISKTGETYLWYFPDGTPASLETSTSPEAEPTDGWGSSAMLWALIEGLAGAQDWGRGFDVARLAPRWLAAGVERAQVDVGYEASGRRLGYSFEASRHAIELEIRAEGSKVSCHVLLPRDGSAKGVELDGREIPFRNQRVENSPYVDFEATVSGAARVRISLVVS